MIQYIIACRYPNSTSCRRDKWTLYRTKAAASQEAECLRERWPDVQYWAEPVEVSNTVLELLWWAYAAAVAGGVIGSLLADWAGVVAGMLIGGIVGMAVYTCIMINTTRFSTFSGVYGIRAKRRRSG